MLGWDSAQFRVWPTFRSEEHPSQMRDSNPLSDLLQFTFRKLSFWKNVPSAWVWVIRLYSYRKTVAKERKHSCWRAAHERLPRTERRQRLVALLNPQEPTHSEQQDSARSIQGHQHVLVSTTGCIALTTPTRAVAVTPRQKVHVYMYIHT